MNDLALQRRPKVIAAGVVALLVVLCACSRPVPPPGAAAVGTGRISITQTMDAGYAAGFRTESQLLAVTSIALAESGLRPRARKWHPEYGYRPKQDVLGVAGGREVTSSDGRQVHSDRGLWQISSRWWPAYTDADCDNPGRAARAVYAMSRRGADFSLWDSYKSGAAKLHYDRSADGWPALRPLVRSFLSAKR